MSDITVTTHRATASAATDWDRVSFALTVEKVDRNGPAAKEAVTQIVNSALKGALATLENKGVAFSKDDNKASLSLRQEMTWDEKRRKEVPAGYRATYNLYLETSQVDKVSLIQDVLTSIDADGITVGTPSFILQPEKSKTLQDTALKNAFELATTRVQKECEIPGVDFGSLQIESWNVQYNDHRQRGGVARAAMYAAGAADMETLGGNSPLEIQGGKAQVEVTLVVAYCYAIDVSE